MTTKHEMPVLTDWERVALIADCKELIFAIEFYVKHRPHDESAKRDLMLRKIALAALTAEPALWSYWFDSKIEYQEARFGCPKKKNGKEVQGTFYTAPPVPVLKSVVLPDAWPEGGDADSIVMSEDEVIEALRTAGYPIAGEES